MTDRLMPDFTDALEHHLRSAPPALGPEPPTAPVSQRSRTPRLALAALSCVAVAATLLAVLATNDTGTRAAYGRPAVLRTPIAANAAEVLASLNEGQVVNALFGKDGRMTEARAVPAFGGTAYFATGPQGWCLKTTTPTTSPAADPLRTGGVTCRPTKDVYAYGIALAVGGNLIAAVPENATHPTITAADGTSRTLTPSAQGIVIAQAPTDSLLKLYGADGSVTAFRVLGGQG